MPRTKKADANAPAINITKKTNSTSSSTSKQPTAAEMKEFYEKNKRRIENFDAANEAFTNFRDTSKSTTYTTISNFNKEDLRSYLQNITSNEVNLRNLSRYLYYRSQVYFRLIAYNANMFCLDARTVIPDYDLVEDNDKDAMVKSYNDTLKVLDKINLQYEFLKAYMTCFREDVFYGCYYFNPESDGKTPFFILPLPADYCRISGVYTDTGDFTFTMNMDYFKRNKDLLDLWGEPFVSMYNKSQQSGESKWQPIGEQGVCLKFHAEDWETIVPVFSGLLNSLINLLDLEDIQSIADQQEIYKMIWMELETLSGADDVNEWKVDPDLVLPYWQRMVNEALPDYTSAAIIPGKINQISFDSDKATDTNKVENATKTVLNTSGGAQILNSSSISGSTAFNAAIRADTEFAISMLLPQTQAIVNRIISYYVDNPSFVKFIEISVYTKDAYKDSILKDNTYGLAPKLLVNSLNGFSERETLSLHFLENECLNLNFVPVQSSHTTSNTGDNEGVKPTLSDTEISDEGEASRDKKDKAKG